MRKIKVYIIESERGWGNRIDEIKKFSSRKKALAFCNRYNRDYNPPRNQAPDWFMYAQVETEGVGSEKTTQHKD